MSNRVPTYRWEPGTGNSGGWNAEQLSKIPELKRQIVAGLAGELFMSEICQSLSIPVHTVTVQKWRQEDKEFDDACNEAVSSITDTLERSAIHRARDGILEPVVSGGKVVMDPDSPGRPLLTRRYSDGLLWNLLKSRRREVYGEKTQVDANIQLDVAGARDDLSRKFASAVATAEIVRKHGE